MKLTSNTDKTVRANHICRTAVQLLMSQTSIPGNMYVNGNMCVGAAILYAASEGNTNRVSKDVFFRELTGREEQSFVKQKCKDLNLDPESVWGVVLQAFLFFT